LRPPEPRGCPAKAPVLLSAPVVPKDHEPLASPRRDARAARRSGRRNTLGRRSASHAADHSENVAGGVPILAQDMYEHAYHIDFGARAAAAARAEGVRRRAGHRCRGGEGGADHEDKQEIEPALLAAAKVVTDLTAQAAAIGELHHAIAAGAMSAQDVHAGLGELVCGRKPGRESGEEITIFDSTGTGLQDVAAAVAAYRAAASAVPMMGS